MRNDCAHSCPEGEPSQILWRIVIACWLYVNMWDQSSIFTHETRMLISILWKCFLAFNVLNMTRTDSWIQQNFGLSDFKEKTKVQLNSKLKYLHSLQFIFHFWWLLVVDQLLLISRESVKKSGPPFPVSFSNYESTTWCFGARARALHFWLL